MAKLITIHPINNAQLADVVEKMRALGSPTIRVVDSEESYIAIEGTHRIEAARLHSLPILLEVLSEDDLIKIADMDISINWDEVPTSPITLREVVCKLRGACNGEYTVDSDGMLKLIRPAKYPPIPPLNTAA